MCVELEAIEQIKRTLDLPHVNSTQVSILLAQALAHSRQNKGWDTLTGFADSHVRYRVPGAYRLKPPSPTSGRNQQKSEEEEHASSEDEQHESHPPDSADSSTELPPGVQTEEELAALAFSDPDPDPTPTPARRQRTRGRRRVSKVLLKLMRAGRSLASVARRRKPSGTRQLLALESGESAEYRIPPHHLYAIENEFGHWMRARSYPLENKMIEQRLAFEAASMKEATNLPPRPIKPLVIPTRADESPVPPEDIPWNFQEVQTEAVARQSAYATAVMKYRCQPTLKR